MRYNNNNKNNNNNNNNVSLSGSDPGPVLLTFLLAFSTLMLKPSLSQSLSLHSRLSLARMTGCVLITIIIIILAIKLAVRRRGGRLTL